MKVALFAFIFTSSVALADQTEWTIGGVMLSAPPVGEVRHLTTPDGSKLHKFAENEVVSASIVSKGNSCLLLLVMTARPAVLDLTGGGLVRARDYGYVLRVIKGLDGRLAAQKVMDGTTPFMKERHRWVRELGAVSDDGSTALIKFGEADANETPYTMHYAWQTWELDTPKMRSDGLSLDNGK